MVRRESFVRNGEVPVMTNLYALWWLNVGADLPKADHLTVPQAYQVTRCVARHHSPCCAAHSRVRSVTCRPTWMT